MTQGGAPTAKTKKTEEPEEKDPRRVRDTVSQVAFALRHRDAIVHSALDFLEGAGFIAAETRAEVLTAYERGDTATRLAIQELIARVLKVPLEALGEGLAEGQVDPARISRKHLRALESLSLPQVDVEAVAGRLRGFDLEGILSRRTRDSRLMAFVTDIPVHLNALRLGMLFGGIAILVLSAVALLFPEYAAWIAFYGLIGLAAVLGGLMVTWAIRLERGARALGVDLVVFARLTPEERRILILRKLILGATDTERLGDLVEKGLHSMLPERMQAPHRDAVPPPRRPLPVQRDPPKEDPTLSPEDERE